MHKTLNDLPAKTRTDVIKILNARLADAADLALIAKLAHWNVRGMDFISLHKLFDDVADMAGDHADTIAERIGQLGGVAQGTAKQIAARSTLPAFDLKKSDGKAVVTMTAKSLAKFAKECRIAIETTDDLDDEVTSDLFTEVTRATDKMLWFVEAHLQ
jgi:starvation-inducible DNA-binding protein